MFIYQNIYQKKAILQIRRCLDEISTIKLKKHVKKSKFSVFRYFCFPGSIYYFNVLEFGQIFSKNSATRRMRVWCQKILIFFRQFIAFNK